MVRRGPLKSLSVVVDPSHRAIVDDTDRPRTGRVILDGGGQGQQSRQPLIPPSPAPGASFGLQQARPRPSLSLPSANRQSSLISQAATGDDAMDVSAPSSPVLGASTTVFPVKTAARTSDAIVPRVASSTLRRTSALSLPSLHPQPPPTASGSGFPTFDWPSRNRNDSTTSLGSLQQNRSRASSSGAEPGKFTYLNSAASSASHTALNSITVPEPYRNGPVQVLPGIWLGCEENAKDWESLKRCGISSVLNVAKEIVDLYGSEATTAQDQSVTLAPLTRVRPSISTPNLQLGKLRTDLRPRSSASGSEAVLLPADSLSGRPELHYLHLPWSHGQADLVENGFSQAMQFCDEAITRGKGVLIHCQCGVSRSATLVIALVMRAAAQPNATDELRSLGTKMQAAYDFVKTKSVVIGPNMSLMYQLLDYEKKLNPRLTLSRTTSHDISESDGAMSDHLDSPEEPRRYLSEEEQTRAEEEEWARNRRRMEDEEERERLESLRAAGASHLSIPELGSGPVSPLSASSDENSLAVPWSRDWFPSGSGPRSTKSVVDDAEAINLDKAMEERQLRRKSSATSIASSCASGLGGAPPPATLSAPLAAWKARFGHAKRVRASSVESSVAGRSTGMLSVEEVDEVMEDTEEQKHEEHVDPDRTFRPSDVAVRWSPQNTRPLSEVSTDSKSLFSSAADSSSVSEISLSDDAASPSIGDEESYQYLTAPPLDDDVVTTPVTSPATVFSLPVKKALGKGPQAIQIDEPSAFTEHPAREVRGFQFVLEEATPRTARTARRSPFNEAPIPPSTASRLASNRSMSSPLGSIMKDLPPPSASAFKTSFGFDDIRQPPPSASHNKLAFSRGDLAKPPRKSNSPGRVSKPGPSPDRPKRNASRSPIRLPSVSRRLSRNPSPSPQPVPSSPPEMQESESVTPQLLEALDTPMASSEWRLDVRNATVPNAVGRKRSKSKPLPLPLANQQDVNERSPSKIAAYVWATSGRKRGPQSVSSSSSSSVSSVASGRSSLRNRVLAKIAGSSVAASSSSPSRPVSPGPPTATPHQTFFIFPPSPDSKATSDPSSSSLPPSTPNAFVLTTSMSPSSVEGTGSSALPLLTPTPTLSTFGTPSLSRKSSMSSTSSNRSRNGHAWITNVASSAPTTACSRVDARGWLAR